MSQDAYPASKWRAGDIGFARTTGIMGRAIRYAERRDGEDSDINHAFVLDEKTPAGWVVIQAELRGVTDTRLLDEVAPGGVIQVHPFPDAKASRTLFLEFVRGQVGDDYSLMAIASNVFDMYLPDAICLRRADTWICSGLVAGGLLYSGYPPMIKLPDLYTVTPPSIRKTLPTYGLI